MFSHSILIFFLFIYLKYSIIVPKISRNLTLLPALINSSYNFFMDFFIDYFMDLFNRISFNYILLNDINLY